MANLTKRFIDSLEVTQTREIYWDSALKGFGLLHLPSGVKTFVLDYRNADGRKRRVTVGRFGPLTVDEARSQARRLSGEVAKGGDPAAAIRARRQAPTVSELLDDYVAKHLMVENAPRTRATALTAVNRHIRPALGALKVASVTRQDVARFHRRMADTPRQANLTLAVLSKAFSLAEEWQWRPEGSNPCRRVPRFDEIERERFLSADELARLGRAIEEGETIGLPWRVNAGAKAKHRPKEENRRTLINARALAAVRLLLFTGARLSEILELKWDQVDFERGVLALPGRKGGTRRDHPVSSMALAILAELPHVKLKDAKESPWVLPAPLDAAKPLSPSVASTAWESLRAYAGLEDVHLHDLRHTAGTFVSQTGANAFLVRDFLRHKTLAMTNRYANRDEDPIRAVSESVGRRIAAGLSGVVVGEVVTFKKRP
jgi:integrase